MVKHWTDSELSIELSKLMIIVDTREKQNNHILDFFDQNKIPYKVRKLDSGDYSAMVGDLTLEHDVFIERKNSLTEICGNFAQNRERFDREFTRAKADGAKPFILVENNTTNDVFKGNYRSQMPPKALWASFCTWMVRYNTTILFSDKAHSGKIIYSIMYYYARELMLHRNG